MSVGKWLHTLQSLPALGTPEGQGQNAKKRGFEIHSQCYLTSSPVCACVPKSTWRYLGPREVRDAIVDDG